MPPLQTAKSTSNWQIHKKEEPPGTARSDKRCGRNGMKGWKPACHHCKQQNQCQTDKVTRKKHQEMHGVAKSVKERVQKGNILHVITAKSKINIKLAKPQERRTAGNCAEWQKVWKKKVWKGGNLHVTIANSKINLKVAKRQETRSTRNSAEWQEVWKKKYKMMATIMSRLQTINIKLAKPRERRSTRNWLEQQKVRNKKYNKHIVISQTLQHWCAPTKYKVVRTFQGLVRYKAQQLCTQYFITNVLLLQHFTRCNSKRTLTKNTVKPR